jgi:predicted RNase H-like HicB family nuclease
MNDLKISKSEGWYVAEVPSLHVVTRARTLKSLRKNLKEAIEVAVDGLLEMQKYRLAKVSARIR